MMILRLSAVAAALLFTACAPGASTDEDAQLNDAAASLDANSADLNATAAPTPITTAPALPTNGTTP